MQRVAIIMAGGVGERFWPLSRQEYPKQLLKIGDHRTMLDAAMERIQPLVDPEHIYIITGKSLKAAIEREAKGVRPANVIAEPEGKNTAACLALASALIRKKFGDAVTFVLTADHFIHDVAGFQRDCRAAGEFAESHDALVTFGVRPDRPETGYGYIELGEPASASAPIFKVTSFREKPDARTAQRFLEEGGFLWNSGMFVWKNSTLRDAFAKHLPATAAHLDGMERALETDACSSAMVDIFSRLEKISIDVGVMERADNVYVLRASFDWDDIGTWTSLPRLLGRDAAGNVIFGDGALLKSEDCIIYSMDHSPCPTTPGRDSEHRPRLVVGYNLKGMVMVSTPDAVLILPAEDVQRVKDVVAYLRDNNLKEYL